MKEKIHITLDADILAWLKARALELDRSVSWVINDIVKDKKK